ncbi:thiamine-phosphate kinase [Sphingobium sufflavum]|uniref:thiamine-phosphate kinase n=1 Tax=Sphingobium sufflavum TaxID=1129547 RepID=UPI001F48E9E1|nr:thiamine-phosphate kinase [Sphingobium sufflavum]MCE7795534.1 thiamine-phosphate kinase [Sphingobium sufflavum]
MSRESAFIDRLRGFATHPAARGLADDAAVLPRPGGDIVLTHDMLVEGVHYLPDDTPVDVAWKLLAVNLSDLAAKGAAPLGVLLGYAMTDDADWDAAFAAGLGAAAAALGVPILGGDTVRLPSGAPRTLGLTALGAAPATGAPSRSGARAGDSLWVSGSIGDSALGLTMRQAATDRAAAGQAVAGQGATARDPALLLRYARPTPRLTLGQGLAAAVSAMADVSDGLLIDAGRMALASGCAIHVDLDAVPLSAAFVAVRGADGDARLFAATGGDDYELLFAAREDAADTILSAAWAAGVPVTPVGRCTTGAGLHLTAGGLPLPLPDRLGWLHD